MIIYMQRKKYVNVILDLIFVEEIFFSSRN